MEPLVIARRDQFTKTGHTRVQDQVGRGKLVGKLTVNQVYAKYQHERPDLNHPRGGTWWYLKMSFFTHYSNYLQRIAVALLNGDPEDEMAQSMEHLNTAMSSRTPILFNNLRRSGRPRVYSNGAKVYDRAAWQGRLSKAQLRALRRRGRGRRRGRRG
jgi:hypothetical protein